MQAKAKLPMLTCHTNYCFHEWFRFQ